METKATGFTLPLERLSFKEDSIKKILANLVRVKWFYEKFGSTFKPYDCSTIDPKAPHEIMEQIFIEAKEHFEKFGTLINQDILKHEIDLHFKQFKKDEKQLPDWYALVDELFGYQDEDLKTEYYAEQMAGFFQVQELKLAFHKAILEDLPKDRPDVVLDNAIDNLIKVRELSEPIEMAASESQPVLYPKNAIQGFIEDLADIYSGYLESPYEFWVFGAATCLGNIFSTRVKLGSQLFVQPRLYTVCIGTLGDARKSESGRQTINLFSEMVAHIEEVQYDEKGKRLASKYFNTLWGCGSAEGLMDRLERTPKLILVYDELRSFVQKSDIKGSNLLQSVNSLFDSNLVENATKDKYRRVDNAYLSMLGFCTTDTWDSLFSPAFLDIGFINRLWIVPGIAEKKDFNPDFIPAHKKLELSKWFQRVLRSFPEDQPTIIKLTHAAEVDLNTWYHSFESTEFTRRLDDYGRRLLLIMAISENKKEIDEGMAGRVISLLEWQKKVREMHQPADYTSPMSRIENLMRKAVKRLQPITKGNLLHQIHAKQFDIWRVEKALEGLLKNGEFRRTFKGRHEAYVLGNVKNE